MKTLLSTIIAFASLYILSSCAGMAYQKCGGDGCHYYKDGVRISDEEAAGNNTAIAEEVKAKKAAVSEQNEFKAAPKRRPEELVHVSLMPVQTLLQGQVKYDPKMHTFWKNLFPETATLKMTPDDKIRRSPRANPEFNQTFFSGAWVNTYNEEKLWGEVLVHLYLTQEDYVGVDQNKKVVAAKRLVLNASLFSTYFGKTHKISEPIKNILSNQEAFQALAEKVKVKIETEIKKNELPSYAWLLEREQKRSQASEPADLRKVLNFNFGSGK